MCVFFILTKKNEFLANLKKVDIKNLCLSIY